MPNIIPPTLATYEDGANDVGDPSDTLDDKNGSKLGNGETKDVQSASMGEGLQDDVSDDAEGAEDSESEEDEMNSSSESEVEEDSDGGFVFEL